MTTMRAARYYGKEDIRIEKIPEPECKPGQIKVWIREEQLIVLKIV
jgi:threonine dehydrogenase-like Zn-dependent dehydrogenase